MSLLCTAISAIKLWAFQQLQGQKEFYYKCVPLIIWSMTELSVGIVVANLPPLRKSFDSLLRSILPTSLSHTRDSMRFKDLHLPAYFSRNTARDRASGGIGKSHTAVLATIDTNEEAIMRDIDTAESQKGDIAMFASR
ncbi:hypothetical protein A1F97_10825 [Pyrenophora tritici-repentis]|nr:hypothetical protein PtrSN001C_011238 [Pyrenophora tritici-repentis]KAI1561550.1 hypothetical protein PtrEW7m1_011198 [Pyrenophora tritici-repentis]PZD26938.1 hypothetical protein A1F97_10825 [Pyrenophora tritici-repentis]